MTRDQKLLLKASNCLQRAFPILIEFSDENSVKAFDHLVSADTKIGLAILDPKRRAKYAIAKRGK